MRTSNREKLIRLYSRTYNNCIFYKNEGKMASLMNEIGVLRGIAYCIEAIVDEGTLFCYIDMNSFHEMIQIQQRLREELVLDEHNPSAL